MNGSRGIRIALTCALWALAALWALVAAVAVAVALVDAGCFHGPLIRFLSVRTERQFRVDGPVKMHLFSLHPQVMATHVTIGNPRWVAAGEMAQIGRLAVTFDLPLFGRSFGLSRLEMDDATFHLARDSAGHANWRWSAPGKGSKGLPLIRSLSLPQAHVLFDDARRHLQFDGTVSARDMVSAGTPLLRIEGQGRLNGRAATFQINGGPLAAASHARPYHFTFEERSSGSRLGGRGFLLRAFNFNALDATFEAKGADLKDLYFLTGVKLPDTNSYHLSGKFARRGRSFRYSDLFVTSGQSDMRGTLAIETSSGRPRLTGDLYSQLLRLADLGARAAGRAPDARTVKPLLLPDTALHLSGMRRSDAAVNFHAREAQVGRVSLKALSAKVLIEAGVLTVKPLEASVAEGRLTAQLRIDATAEVPAADLDLKIAALRLEQFDRKDGGQAPLDGPLSTRFNLTGRGQSLHQFAASADGTVTAVLPRGAIRASLAELIGTDLRGLGLLLTKNKQDAEVRCGVANFKVQRGVMTAQTLVIDTEPVLITANGTIHLDSEDLDLEFRGQPKHLRLLRLRSPVTVHGTLLHPSIGMKAGNSIAQTGAAVALGVALTPLAAVLAFVDPGLAKDADCASLLAATKTGTPADAAVVR